VILFGCGYVVNYAQHSIWEFIITRIDHVANNIIPFFDKHPIMGSNILKNKEHLNPDRKG
jgi:hypothetical protein